ncbi:hypothetical protein LMG9964_02099 [Paraburkholderia phenoliruptrix]|uniref:Uncharacterized protein n=1 Tax=Paraburkholderia phenoliruptrix TaxID=252970 RepID=A0A6J5K3W9_9BURK|nr:hypothetical protein [Paraburkholderia phenoliruptrix]CAB4048460.1 hypothetical protein LMG9964_02099 [Paraburkholderia phenoliruptrix]
MVGLPGPSDDQYRKFSRKGKLTYWCAVALVFSAITTLWIVKILNS